MRATELREMTDQELIEKLRERNDALWTFRFQAATGVVENARGAREARRDIARIQTVIRERELQASGGTE